MPALASHHPLEPSSTMDSEFTTTVLNRADLYVPSQDVFDFIQGTGVKMTESEFAAHDKNKKKRKREHIAFGGYYHKGIFTFSKEIEAIVLKHKDLFPRVPLRQSSDRVHAIGITIMSLRRYSRRADIHSIPAQSFHDLVNAEQNKNLSEFYYLSQRDVLLRLHQNWGKSVKGLKKIEHDDIMRCFGILLTDDDLKCYVSDLTGDTLSGARAGIDARSSRVLACYALLLNKFIDEEVVVKIHPDWTHPYAKKTIDAKTKEGTYDKFGTFNANNRARMDLPWTKADMRVRAISLLTCSILLHSHHVRMLLCNIKQEIFTATFACYTKTMSRWTQNTGGGDGNAVAVVVWEERDAIDTATYHDQAAMLYLAPIYMWDKDLGYMLVKPKSPIPPGAAI